MKFVILSIVWLISISYSVVDATVPKTFPVKANYESEFAFSSNTKISLSVIHMTQQYSYNVLVRKGPNADQLVLKLENPEVNDRLTKPTKKDLTALQLPFIVTVDNTGNWKSITTSPDETKVSLEQKENVATVLTYDDEEFFVKIRTLKQTVRSHLWQSEETPLGNCTSKSTVETIGDLDVVTMTATRANCTGAPKGGMLDEFGIDIANDSTFEYKFSFDNLKKKFDRADLTILMRILTVPPADVRVKQEMNFVRYREVTDDIDLSRVTVEHTLEELEKSSLSETLF